MEKGLGRIAEDAFESSARSACGPALWEETAAAVEKAVLARLKKSEFEPVAGQELSFVQVAQWVERRGSAKGLQWLDSSRKWRDEVITVIYVGGVYRVAPKNDPDDPATWEKGVAIFRRDAEDATWILDVFRCYKKNLDFKYATNVSSWRYAKLATPEQIEAWKLINDDL